MINQDYEIKSKTSQYFAANMITQNWVQTGAAEHKLFKAASDVKDESGNVLVTAYAVLRPDGKWSLMVINKDRDHPQDVRISFDDGSGGRRTFDGNVNAKTFGAAQYQWHSARRNGYADPDTPPVSSTITATPGTVYTLPAASLNVFCGSLSPQ